MALDDFSRKTTGNTGERVAVEYLRKRGFDIIGRNIARKTGELDIVASKEGVWHVVEVKAVRCKDFPGPGASNGYDPGQNLHALKIAKVRRTAEWYVSELGWEGEWQIDAALIWLRNRDGIAKIQYYPQIL